MKEFPLELTKSVSSGLSRIVEPVNAKGLVKSLGLRPRAGFLVHGDTVHNPLGQVTVSWPYPQVFFGMDETVVATATTIYSVNEEASWDLTTIVSGITQGTGWQFADFGDFWVMFNGVEIVLRDRAGATVYTSPVAEAGTCHMGRLFWGGFSSGFWSTAWRAELTRWLAKEPTGLTGSFEMSENYVFWGMPGGGDFKCWLTDPTSISYPIVGPGGPGGGYDLERPFYQDLLRQRTIGWSPMPWKGRVMALHGLGPNIVVCGSSGISALTPLDAGYGVKELTNEVGIIGRLAAKKGDDKTGIMLVGADHAIYRVAPDLQFTRLGYEHHLEDLDLGTVVNYDKRWKEFYFSNPKRCFVLSPDGMGESHRSVTSLSRQNGQLLGPSMAGTESKDQIELETETFRMGSGSFKMLRSAILGVNKIQNLSARAVFRSDPNRKFRVGKSHRVNKSGSARLDTSAVDFRVNIQGDAVDDSAAITDFRCRWQITDNRDVRGLYGETESNRTG